MFRVGHFFICLYFLLAFANTRCVRAQSEMPTVAWQAVQFLEKLENKIELNDDGEVIEITMTEVPPGFVMGQLAVFPKLEAVKIKSRYYFRDANMGGMRKLQNLKKMSLERSRYCTETSLELLAEAPSLREVEIINCSEISSLHELTRIRNLEKLKLLPSDDLPLLPLTECRNLKHLDFKDANSVDDKWIEPLARLKSLETIDLSGTMVTDEGIASLSQLPNLKTLRLEGCKSITGIGLESFPESPPLVELNLRNASSLTDEGLAAVARFTNLENLYTCANRRVLGPGYQCLAALKELKILSCPKTAIADEHLQLLDGIDTLEVIWLYGCQGVSGRGLQKLVGSESVRRLSLNECPLIDSPDFDVIAQFKNLQDLYLSDTRIRPAGIEQLGQLKQLKTLNISGNIWLDDSAIEALKGSPVQCIFAKDLPRLTRDGIAHFSQFPKLEKLTLTATRNMTGEGFQKLAGCESLEFLSIQRVNFLSLDCFAAIRMIPNLKELQLNDDKISLVQLQQLSGMENLETLKFQSESKNSEQLRAIFRRFPKLDRDKN